MGRKLDHITFYRPGFKLVMARKEVRKDNGDLEVPPSMFRRTATGWELLAWDSLPDEPSIDGLIKAMKRRRDDHCPTWRNPIGDYAAQRMSLDSVPDYIAAKNVKMASALAHGGP